MYVARLASSVCLVLGAFLHCYCIWHERCRGRTDTRVYAVSGSTVHANATYHCAPFSPQVIFNRSRYKAALALMEKPIDADLLTRWVHHLKVRQQQQHSTNQAQCSPTLPMFTGHGGTTKALPCTCRNRALSISAQERQPQEQAWPWLEGGHTS